MAEMQSITTAEELLKASVELVESTQLELMIFSRDLDPQIYNHADFLAALRQKIVDHSRMRVRILLQDSERAIKYGHRLIEMTQRLSSFIEIRKPRGSHAHFGGAFLIGDDRNIIWRSNGELFDGEYHTGNPLMVRERSEVIEAMWEHAHPDPNLRRLHL